MFYTGLKRAFCVTTFSTVKLDYYHKIKSYLKTSNYNNKPDFWIYYF